MLNRLRTTGLNLTVLAAAVLVFAAAFCALNGLATARIPASINILTAARDLAIGETIDRADLAEKTIYQDETLDLYIPAAEIDSVIGGAAALPVRLGQPLLRENLIAPAAAGVRLSAALADYPGYSLFPLPLDEDNITAPGVEWFLPGDLIAITVVLAARPPVQETPDPFTVIPIDGVPPEAFPSAYPPGSVSGTSPQSESAASQDADQVAALARLAPPLAKDLFPGGVRVIWVQGLPAPVEGDASGAPVFNPGLQNALLIILIPDDLREELALAMQQGAQVFISLLGRSDSAGPSAGFSYWDLEDLLRADRVESLQEAP